MSGGTDTAAVPDIAARQSQGARDYQEDCLGHAVTAGGRVVLVLADGMGGHAGGREASAIAVREALAVLVSDPRGAGAVLPDALEAASGALAEATARHPELSGMGTTLVCALLEAGRLSWLSVGDSHLYLHRGGVLTKLNADHSMAPVLARMVRDGDLDADAAARDPRRNMLRSALTGEPPELVDLSEKGHALRPGDVILLASDGLDTLTPEALAKALEAGRGQPLDRAAAGLLQAVEAANRPRQDNSSVLMLRLPEGPAAPAGTPPAPAIATSRGQPWRFASFALGGALVALLLVLFLMDRAATARLTTAQAELRTAEDRLDLAREGQDALLDALADDLAAGRPDDARARLETALGRPLATAEAPPTPETAPEDRADQTTPPTPDAPAPDTPDADAPTADPTEPAPPAPEQQPPTPDPATPADATDPDTPADATDPATPQPEEAQP